MGILRWGILSTARINRRFVPGLQLSAGSRLEAVASRSLKKAQEFAATWNIPKVFDSYSALLQDPQIEAVYIPLPNHLHLDWCIAAARAGKHILCEKPLGLTGMEVEQMQEAARDAGVHLIEAFQFLSHPLMQRLLELARAPETGRIRLLRGHFGYSLSDSQNVRLRYPRGGGCLWDVGCYPVRFMLELLDADPIAIEGMAVRNEAGIDLSFSGQLLFPEGIIGQFQSSFLTPYAVGAEIVGETGRIVANDAWRAGIHERPSVIRWETKRGTRKIQEPADNPFLRQVQEFEKLIQGEPATLSEPRQSLRLARTLAALHQASASPAFWK